MDLEAERLKRLMATNETKSLISIRYGSDRKVMAYRNMRWNPESHELSYTLYEPQLLETERDILRKGEATIRGSDQKAVSRQFNTLLEREGYGRGDVRKVKLQYFIFRDMAGLGPIEPLMHDDGIALIECAGPGQHVMVEHRDMVYGRMETNIVFNSRQFDWFIGRLRSSADPAFRFEVNGGFRVMKFTRKPMTVADLVEEGVASPEILAYVWYMVENRKSVVVAGSSSTGKTEFMNAVSSFIKPGEKVVSIEGKPQLRLSHPNWKPRLSGDRFSLAASALREKPGCMVFDDITDDEMYIMLQAARTGHGAISSVHVDNLPELVSKLKAMPGPLEENLDMIVFMILTKRNGKYVRRVSEVIEIVGYDRDRDELVTNTVFRWNPAGDSFSLLKSVFLTKLEGGSLDRLKKDMETRIRFINSLKRKPSIGVALDIARFRRRSRSGVPGR